MTNHFLRVLRETPGVIPHPVAAPVEGQRRGVFVHLEARLLGSLQLLGDPANLPPPETGCEGRPGDGAAFFSAAGRPFLGRDPIFGAV